MLKNKIIFTLLLGTALTFSVPAVNASAAVANGWEQANGNWYYYENSTMKTNSWIAGTGSDYDKWYYVGKDGAMVKNDWVKHTDGNWYYLGSDGAMITTQWIPGANNNGKWYYVNEKGIMQTNSWIEGRGNYYGYWYYVGEDGAMVTNKWIEGAGSKWYYLGEDGAMLTNTTTPDGYWVGSDGAWNGQVIVNEAKKYLGVPYVYGANGPYNFDCSGLVQYVYKQALGISLGRTTYDQVKEGRAVSRDELQPGDLVFPHSGHVQIYIGNGQVIHAPQTGDVVKISPLGTVWSARRILG